jgi:hypothetical protein
MEEIMSHHHHCHSHSHECPQCSQSSEGSCSCSCHKGEHHQEENDFSKQLLELADEAWMELLKDKIKQQILTNNGNKIEQLAKLVADSNNERWKNKLGIKKCCNNFKEKLENYFSSEK